VADVADCPLQRLSAIVIKNIIIIIIIIIIIVSSGRKRVTGRQAWTHQPHEHVEMSACNISFEILQIILYFLIFQRL